MECIYTYTSIGVYCTKNALLCILIQLELRTAIANLLSAKNEASILVIHLNPPQKPGTEHGQQREATLALSWAIGIVVSFVDDFLSLKFSSVCLS